MKIKTFLIVTLGIFVFSGLVFYNYFVAQKKLREVKPAALGISLLSYPNILKAGQTGTFIWNVDATSDQSTPQTAIYWGYIASPSALTFADSPDAVGYPNRENDYWQGTFKLPETFDVNIHFDKPGIVYFRAYAKVGKDYLWTEENFVDIKPNN